MAKRKTTQERVEISADKVVDLLRDKHTKDVFVSECKDGPTWYGGHLRLDAWVMARSWAHPLVTGYEIKVSRRDFLGDKKWDAYLPLCNEMYFVCPRGVIDPNELPPEVGLLLVSDAGGKLLRRKPAQRRQVQIPEDVFRYILMSRCKIVSRYETADRQTDRDYWAAWLIKRKEDQDLGHKVSKRIRQVVDERIVRVEEENRALKKLMEKYDDVRRLMTQMRLNPDDRYDAEYGVARRLENAKKVLPDNLLFHMRRMRDELDRGITTAERIVDEAKVGVAAGDEDD